LLSFSNKKWKRKLYQKISFKRFLEIFLELPVQATFLSGEHSKDFLF